MSLGPWACDPNRTRGRRIAEPPAPPRNEHQRDRDRIVHSTAFRRLVYKTQVFINHEGDLFRTRLTHSLEVAQLARAAARALQLNEDLTEAIALGHDLGHTPFGHAGQDALAECMQGHGGFEHNFQSLRVVDQLEQRYLAFAGLNLTLETREGLLKHCSPREAKRLCEAEPHGPAARYLIGTPHSLEAQVVNLADEMAYSVHDIDDGVRSGLISTQALCEQVPLFARWFTSVQEQANAKPEASPRVVLYESLRRLLSALVHDLVSHTQQLSHTAAAFSPALADELAALKRFLFTALYRHPQVMRNTALGKQAIGDLFAAYRAKPLEMPEEFSSQADQPRAVADYISGMTDRFALKEHERLTGQRLFA